MENSQKTPLAASVTMHRSGISHAMPMSWIKRSCLERLRRLRVVAFLPRFVDENLGFDNMITSCGTLIIYQRIFSKYSKQ